MKSSQLSVAQLFYLALAECRGAWRRFIFFIICLAIGVGAIMTVKSFSLLVENSVRRESKGLLAGDLEISGSWALGDRDVAFLRDKLPAGSEFLSVKELHAMAQFDRKPAGEAPSSLLVELKAVPDSPPLYPFYGVLTALPDSRLPASLENRGALVEPSFLSRSQLKVGDVFKLGSIQARIAGEIVAEPDRITRAFSIGPRVMVSLKTLEEAGLVQPGSRVKHRTLVRLPENAPLGKTKTLVEDNLSDKAANARSYKDMQSSLTHSIERMGQYLGSLGVIALLMGGIGVAMIVRAFMSQKLDTVAILNCLGASSRTVFKIYLLQSLLLGLAGSALGIVLGYGLQYLLPSKLPGLLNISARPEFYWKPALQALLLGLTTTLLFAVWPLVRAVKTRPLRLFRHIAEEEELARGSRRERWASGFLFSLGLVLIVFWQAGSMRRGLVFLAALVVSAAVLSGMSVLALKLLRRLPPSSHMTRRYGLANLFRPNNQASSIITALGMGIMLALTVRLAQMDMVAMLKENAEINPPNYFFIDIQGDQKDKFVAELKRVAPESEWELTPLIRSRLHGAGDRALDNWVFKDRREEEWFIYREFILTFTDGPPPEGNEVVAGKWWDRQGALQPQVSLEEDAARRLGAGIGSVVTMDVQGVLVSAPVTSIRRVNWRNMRANFYMIFSPGAIAEAPATFVGTVRVAPEKELALQDAVVKALPNVTALSVRDIVATVENVTGKLLVLVDFMSGFTIAAGLFILSGAVASTKFRRLKEAAILKTLGASRKAVALVLGYEYAVLGLIASLVGAALSLGLSWGVVEYLVETKWRFHPVPLAGCFAAAVALTATAGILSSLDALRNKPLETLRRLDG